VLRLSDSSAFSNRRFHPIFRSALTTNGVSKKPLKKNESLLKRVEEDLGKIKKDRALVRSFFGANSVLYAKD